MDIKVLRYFLALAKEGTVSAAAQYLHLTQPTLSRQLSELEEELGAQLFIRGSRKITLTDDGLRFRKRAEEIVDMVQKTQAEFHAASDTICGDIYIGGGESDAMRWIARVIKSLQEDYPQIRIHLFSGDADEVTDRIDKGLLDFGILIDPAPIHKYESMRLPATDVWGVLMRKDAPLAQRATIHPQDLWGLPLINSKQKFVDDNIAKWLKRDYSKLNIVGTYNLIFNASVMVEEGVGYALCIDKLIKTTEESKLCFRPLDPALDVGVHMVWKRYQVFSKAAEVFLQRMRVVAV